MTNISSKLKKHSKCIFAGILSVLIVISALCFLAHSFEVSEVSFSPSQIYELTGANKESPEISSKIEEEISGLFN